MTSQPYSYCFLRYFHDIPSGEFANVGILLWAPKSQFLGFRYSEQYSRLSGFFSDMHTADYRSTLSMISGAFEALSSELAEQQTRLSLEGSMESARDLAHKVLPIDSSALQWSAARGGVIESPEVQLEELFQAFIGKHLVKPDQTGRDKQTIYKTVYKPAFTRNAKVAKHFTEYTTQAPLASVTFPKAWKNGVMNVYDTVSFDMKDGDRMRDKAHRLASQTRFIHDEEQSLNITYLLGAPQNGLQKQYRDAKAILQHGSEVSLVEEKDVEDFSDELEQKVLTSLE